MPRYKENELDNVVLKCPNCGWNGNGSDAVIIDFYGISKFKELHCPRCDEKLGEVVNADDAVDENDDQISNQLG